MNSIRDMKIGLLAGALIIVIAGGFATFTIMHEISTINFVSE